MSIPRHSIVTPEAVAVRVDIAELGSRVGAGLIDGLILGGVLTVIQILVGVAGLIGLLGLGDLAGALYAAFLLLIAFGYHPFFEEIWNGQTPGKRAFGLRVIQTDGQPVGLGPVLLRNLLRPFDVLLALMGAFLILFTRRRQRLGDLVAGTIVVRQPKLAQPSPVPLQIPPDADLPPLDTTLLTEEEYELMRSFLERRWQLAPAARMALGNELGNLAWSKVPGAQAYTWGPEVLLEAVLVTVRRQSLGMSGMSGQGPRG
jgi:uncharacterized RDD family membrane protein YckC